MATINIQLDGCDMTGIYIIKNLIDGKVYVGQSKDVRKRLSHHKAYLRRGVHYNTYLQRAFRKHGEKAFKFGVVCKCPEDELDERERGWIDWYQSTDRKHGYNRELGGNAKKIIAEETRRKISKIAHNRSAETKHKISEAAKRRQPISNETRHRMSESQKGRTHNDETRRKISNALKGRTLPEKHRSKALEASKSRSDETWRKISESLKLYYARKKAMENNL